MQPIKTAALLVAMAVSAGAWAHGDESHKKIGPVRQEQKDWGIAGDAQSAKRTIQVGMSDAMLAHAPAGRKAEIIWTFNRPGDVDFACLIAGHYQAGMVGKITVSAK